MWIYDIIGRHALTNLYRLLHEISLDSEIVSYPSISVFALRMLSLRKIFGVKNFRTAKFQKINMRANFVPKFVTPNIFALNVSSVPAK